MIRLKAILFALFYGFAPFWMYEKEKHYKCSYWLHLWINLKYAFRWISFKEDASDWEFERQTNDKNCHFFR
jgi:hypothetical protein